MPPRRIAALAFAADVVAVIVFAAVGRASHAESGDLLGLLGTAAPFLVGLVAAWATPAVRAHPAGLRAGAVVLAGTAVLGLAAARRLHRAAAAGLRADHASSRWRCCCWAGGRFARGRAPGAQRVR